MTSNLKAFGLSFLAAIAVGAVAASAAPAAGFFDEAEKTVVTGSGQVVFSAKSTAMQITCQSSYSGTATIPAQSLTVHPTLFECSMGKVDTTGCNLELFAETTKHKTTNGMEEEEDAPVEFECEVGKAIKFTPAGCTITITNTEGERVHGILYHNEGEGAHRDVTGTVTMDKIKYATEGFGCALVGLPKKGEDGTLTGKITMKGYKDDLCKPGECPFAPAGGGDKDLYNTGEESGLWWE